MNKYIYPMALAATALIATACSDVEETTSVVEEQIPDSQKEMISFSMSDNSASPLTRANTRAGFTAPTRILMRIQSDDSRTSPQSTLYTRTVAEASAEVTKTGGFKCSDVIFSSENGHVRYWDDAYGRNAQLSVYAVAIPGKSGSDGESLLPVSKLKEGNYSGSGDASSENVKIWGTSDDNKILWSVTKGNQTASTIADEDLVYSNNIQAAEDLGQKGRYVYNFTNNNYIPDLTQSVSGSNDFANGRLKFNLNGDDPANNGKFDKGHLVFNHALTRLTVQIIEGAGFNSSDVADFQWKTNTNISIAAGTGQTPAVATAGTLDLQTGIWTGNAWDGIAKLAPLGKTFSDGVYSGDYTDASGFYRAQFLPGYTFTDGSTTNVLSFTIDDNVYYVNQDMIFDALTAAGATLANQTTPITMEQGKNYVLTITVGKTQIANMTATLEDWKDVVANNMDLENSYVTLNLKSATGEACTDFDLYRLVNRSSDPLTDKTTIVANDFVSYDWAGDYTQKATLTVPTSGSTVWKTNWYWDSNKDFYHFRTVSPQNTDVNTSADKDNFTITSGAVSSTDYHWGAPMVTDANLKYEVEESTFDRGGVQCSMEGFGSSIYKAIGSTKDAIAITEIHMMSNIYITVKTKEDGSKVSLYDMSTEKGTKVYLTKFSNKGTVDMGTGYVRPSVASGDIIDQQITDPAPFHKGESTTETNHFSWAVVPQPVSRGAGDGNQIGITIETPDGNKYYLADLSSIRATSVTSHSSTSEITDPNQSKDNAITFWYPGHHYYYTFTISKKGIDNITCTVAQWIDVTAGNKDITLED